MTCKCGPKVALPDGETAQRCECQDTPAKVEYLDKQAHAYAAHPAVRRQAELAASGARSPLEQINLLHAWVRDNVLYTGEFLETFTAPDALLRTRAGDCDDSAPLLAAMLLALGFTARVAKPRELPHVAAQVLWLGRWWWLETTMPGAEPGEHPIDAGRRLLLVD